MLRLLSDKRARISNSSVSPRAPGVLRPLVAQPYACLHFAYCELRSPLRAVFGHRGSFCAVEEVVLPCAPFSRGVDISSGRSRTMAHRRDRISIRNPEEGVRRLAFGMVLYRRRPAVGSYSDRSPGVQQCSFEETPELAPAEPPEGRRQGRPLPDEPNKIVSSFRTDHDRCHGHMHYAGGAAAPV